MDDPLNPPSMEDSRDSSRARTERWSPEVADSVVFSRLSHGSPGSQVAGGELGGTIHLKGHFMLTAWPWGATMTGNTDRRLLALKWSESFWKSGAQTLSRALFSHPRVTRLAGTSSRQGHLGGWLCQRLVNKYDSTIQCHSPPSAAAERKEHPRDILPLAVAK